VSSPDSNSTTRFSDRVADYVRARPRYPRELIPLLQERIGLTPEWVVADIGSGTGISAEPFLSFGNVVYGVEPNAEMRAAGEEALSRFDTFQSVAGTAEDTGLAADSIDLIAAGQAFHWFDRARARVEFERIARPNAWVALFWNRRDVAGSAFAREYEDLLLRYGTDYEKVRHDNLVDADIAGFLGPDFQRAALANPQVFDFAGLRSRLLSSSYTPAAGDPRREEMLAELRVLFDRHEQHGSITIDHTTDIYLAQLARG
jgi:SAM-dependent methyltransferase